ncbi:MAG: SDR family oxidoreductase [Clostridiales bacterium]|nr:SDR family oxidoreductase [Clostridiales bacterium]
MIITSMENAFSLCGKTAIVTGGNKGIGEGITTAFAQSGANVAIVARDEKAGSALVKSLSDKYAGKFAFYAADLTDLPACRAAVDRICADLGDVDILVNNGGVGTNGSILDMDEEMCDYFHCIDVDLNGVVRMTYLVGRKMRDAGKGGRIVNISSNAAVMASTAVDMTAYSTAKAGVNMFTRSMAVELAKYGITVNAIAPGFTYSNLMAGLSEEEIGGIAAKMPTGRLGTPIEIGALAVYLSSDAASQVTGTVVTIDGAHSLAIS